MAAAWWKEGGREVGFGGGGVVNVLDGGSMNLDPVAKVARLRQRMAATREPCRDDGDGNGLRLVPTERHDDM